MRNHLPPIPLAVATVDRLDRPLRDLRISVIDTCNFRCPYCMPDREYPEGYRFLRPAERLSFDEIERVARIFVSLGAVKLRLTGGEPLLRKNLSDLVHRLAAIAGVQDLALTTNGWLLARHARELRDAGLHRITVSLDSLDPGCFRRLTGGRGELSRVLEGVAAAESAGFSEIKFNAVIQRGVNDGEVVAMVEHFRATGHTLRFIEYMDVGTCNGWNPDRVVPSRELIERLAARWPLEPVNPEYRGEVASRYRFLDGGGEVGFISSVSAPFCGDCTRARLSADGRIYKCLFARTGFDLREPLRSGLEDEALRDLIAGVWRSRADRYSELRGAARARTERVEMYQIGG